MNSGIHLPNSQFGEFWKQLTGLRLVENENICIYGGQLYEVLEFIEDKNQTWAGIGVLVKL
jgi:hypothetical protein